MVRSLASKRAIFKLDVRSQKAQGIYKNTTNSLTGASASLDKEAQELGVLQAPIRVTRTQAGSMIRHMDCQIWYNFTMNRYKAIVYLNGDQVQEMLDCSLHELKERLRKKLDELDATSHTPLTKAVL